MAQKLIPDSKHPLSTRESPPSDASGAPTVRDRFNRYADGLTQALGSLWALVASVVVVVIWALTGPVFQFSDTWQLVINTGTTVVTFWMVFVIQNSQNRDAKAVHLKLDEVIRSIEGARNVFMTLENATEAVVASTTKELTGLAVPDTDVDLRPAE